MKWSFKKRIKVIPNIHLNLSTSGITTSIGTYGSTINLGGIKFNDNKKDNINSSIETINLPIENDELQSDNIFSREIQEITSQNMQGVKEAILLARKQRLELIEDLKNIKKELSNTKFKKILSYIFLYGLFNKNYQTSIKEDIATQEKVIVELDRKIEECYVNVDIDFDSELREKYDDLVYAFRRLCTSQKIWDITSSHYENRVKTRSAADYSLTRKSVRFDLKSLPEIKSSFKALYFENANGGDLYFYPTFIVMFVENDKFAIIGIDEILLTESYTRFLETEFVPRDSEIIDKTWAKVNKNGTRDKRFEGNYEIPIVKYGDITLSTYTGLKEQYQISNVFATEKFAEAFMRYQVAIKMAL